MKIAVIGLGSVGSRHVRNLLASGIKEIILLREKGTGNEFNLPEIRSLDELDAANPDMVILANPTGSHFRYLEPLIRSNYNILCEKPLVSSTSELEAVSRMLDSYKAIGRVAFMMRYHPCICRTREWMMEGVIGTLRYARFFAGQYLPDWRPGTNHLESYSAQYRLGGGVSLDLVHEIDLAEYLLGSIAGSFTSVASRVADVTVDSDDIAEITGTISGGAIVNIHLDYLYRGFRRDFILCGSNGSLHCDLKANRVIVTGPDDAILRQAEYGSFQRNDMFLDMMKDFLGEISNPRISSKLPSFRDNHDTMMVAAQTREKYHEKK